MRKWFILLFSRNSIQWMTTPTILWYWVPSDGDDEDHPNAYPIKRAQKDVRLGDVRAVRTPRLFHVWFATRGVPATRGGLRRRRNWELWPSQRLHSSDMLMCRLPPYRSSTHMAPFFERSYACVCVLSLLSLSLSLSLSSLSTQPTWAILRPLSGPTCSAGNGVYVLPSPPAHAFRLLAPLRARACSRSASHTLCFVRCEVGARPTPQPYTSHPPNFSPTPPHHHPPPPPPPTTRRSRSRGRTTFTLNRRT